MYDQTWRHIDINNFKETILKRHKELLHPGIEKTTKWFREKYYFPDYQK